jgi:DNA-binding IclR family transcriptional regulator
MSADYTNDAQQRLIKVILLMFGHVVHGLPPSAIAREVGCSAAVMTRDLANLRAAGIADKDEATGHWRLTPRLPQQVFKVMAAIDSAERRITEVKQRFTKQPN